MHPRPTRNGSLRFITHVGATKKLLALFVFVSVIFALIGYIYTARPSQVEAATSSTLNFQSRLLSNSGNVVPDGYYNIQFNLYTVSSGGASVWTETRDYNGNAPDNRVRVVNGYLTVNLGDVTAFGNLNWDQELWLGMTVRGSSACSFAACTPADSEMTPRMKLTAVPYAFRAGAVMGANGAYSADNLVQLAQTAAQAVNSANTLVQLNQTGVGGLLTLQAGGNNRLVLSNAGVLTVASTGTFQGASVTVGTASQAGSLILNDGTSNTATLSMAAFGQNSVITLPDPGAGTDTICLQTLANCAGSGDIVQNGNSFGADVVIGANDNYGVQIETNGTSVLTLSSTGQALFKNSTNSATAFQIQNSANASVLTVDTTTSGNITLLGNMSGQTSTWTTSANSLPASRSIVGSVYANGYLYAIGGEGGSGGTTSVYYAKVNADGTVGSWSTNANTLPAARRDHAVSVYNGYIYVLGGSADGSTPQSTVYYAKLNSDGSTGSWTTTTALTAARMELSSVVYNGYLYAIGGMTTGPNTWYATVYYAKINANGTVGSWSTTTAIPANRAGHASITANGYIYVTGGQDGSGYRSTVYYGKVAPDGTVASWSTNGNALSSNNAYHNLAVLNGKLYIFGGYDGGSYLSAVEFASLNADGSTGAWSSNSNSLPVTLGSPGAATVNGRIYVIGGTSGGPVATVYHASTARVSVGGSLDLVGLNGENLNEGGTGGSLTAGNTNIIGALQVQGDTILNGSVFTRDNFINNGYAIFQNAANSTNAFQVLNASGAQLIDVDTTTTNLISNGSMEIDATGWSGLASGSVARTTSEKYIGNASLAITTTGANDGARFNLSLSSSTTYYLRFMAKTSSSFTGLELGRSDDGSTNTTCSTGNSPNTTSWKLYTCTITTGTTSGSPYIFVRQSDATGRTIYIDAVQLTTGGQGPYKEGSISLNGVITSPVVIQNQSNTAIGFNIQNANGSVNTLMVDTAQTRIGIATSLPDNTFQIGTGNAATLSSNTGYQTIGTTSSTNLVLDTTQIQARNNGAAATLELNKNGGTVTIGSTTANTINFNNGQQTLSTTGAAVFKNSTDSTTAFQIQNAGSVSILQADTSNGRISIGTNGTDTGQLYVGGNVPTAAAGSVSVGAAQGPINEFASGRYIYVADFDGNNFKVVDVSNPASPVVLGTRTTGTNPTGIFIQDKYAFVTNRGSDTLTIYDVSNPASIPAAIGSIATDNQPYDVYVSGKYAYVVHDDASDARLRIYDVSNPAAPTQVSNTGISETAKSIYVSGKYAYIASNPAVGELAIWDISNPASPSALDVVTVSAGPYKVIVQGKYAYVSSNTSSQINIVDISDPTNISATGSLATTGGSIDFDLQGRYMYVTNFDADTLQVIDVANPAAPASVGTVTTGTDPRSVVVIGRYAYVANYTSNTIQAFDVGGAYIQQLETGGLETGTLTTNGNASFGNDVEVRGGLSVSASTHLNGNLGVGGYALFQNQTDSTTSFQVQNAAGTSNVLVVDTTNTRIGIGKAPTSGQRLEIAGSILIDDASTRYIMFAGADNGGLYTTRDNLTFQSDVDNNGAGDLYNFYGNGDTDAVLNINNTGAATFRNNSDSTTAFQIQNAAGTSNLFIADTSGSRIGIGKAPTAAGVLDVNGGVAGTDYFNLNTSSLTTGNLRKQTTVGTGGVTANDVVILANDGGNLRAITSTTARDIRVYGVAGSTTASGSTVSVVIGGNTQVTADTGAVAIGDQLVVSSTAGQVTVDNSATTGILGTALSTKAGGASGLVSVAVRPVGGQYSPTFRNASDSTAAFQIQNAAGTSFFVADSTNQRVTVGTYGTETAQLYVSGTTPSAALATLSGGLLSGGGDDIDIQDSYAYVASYDESDLDIIDISNPASPSVISSTDFSAQGTSPEAITVSGNYAYLAMSSSDNVTVVNISNPALPTAVTTVATNDYPIWLEARGSYLYVINEGTGDSLQIFDISNPAAPRLISTTGSLNNPRKGYLEGNYIYIAASVNLRVIDISNPASPVAYSETLQTSNAGLAVAKYGRYVYVSDNVNNINVLDASNPTDPVDVTTFFSDADIEELQVQGRFMYGISNQGATSRLITYDLANPAAPVALSNVTTGNAPYHFAVKGRYVYVPNYTGDSFQVFDMGGAYIQQLEAGGVSTSFVQTQDADIRNNLAVGSALNVGGSAQINGTLGVGSTATFNGNLQLTGSGNRIINILQNTSAGTGRTLTIKAGEGNTGNGGQLTLSGGDGNGVNQNGGNIVLQGGAGVGTGVQGLVTLSTSAFTSASTQSFGVSGSLSAGLVDQYSTIPVNATATGLTVTIPVPNASNQVIGRLLYIAAVDNSNDFTISLGGTSITIVMKENSTATLIWNGTGWTAAGASSSTDLQSAYNNTIASAGGAELVLNAPGGAADGLTIRNNATTPITGGLLEVQTSIGSNLFTVNNNATEYATNGGAETAGASSSTFPSSTWDTTTGGTVDRYTTAGDNIATGQASVRVQTTASNHGARNRISTALTTGLTYTVSFAARGATNFTTLEVLYSPDGTTSGTTQCATTQTVTQGIWTRITCSFVAGGTIDANNSILIRQTDGTARTFYIDNLSINVNASATFAADGSVDSALGTNWTAFGTLDALTRETTIIYDTSGSVAVDTPNATDRGVRNNLSVTPAPSTQYLVTFYARSTTSFSDIRVRYTRDGGTNFVNCVDYNTQTVSTSAFTEITCLFTTDSTTATDPDLVIDQPTGSNRIFYIDALSVTLNTNTSNNVQIGGANKGGPVTLFTLDRSNGAPIAANNEAYLGSMYYDTSSGRIQCYEADGWGACGAAPDNIVNLNPEYAGAVLNGSGVGTMTADFCSDDTALSVNTSLCETGQAKNFYRWTSPQASQQTYSIYVTYQLPATFNGFSSDDTVQLTGRVDNISNAAITYQMFKSTGSAVTQCGSSETTVAGGGSGSADTWYSVGINGNEATGCSFTSSSAGNFIIFKINLKANSNANAYVSTLSFTTTGR